jgi:hypothetical protein
MKESQASDLAALRATSHLIDCGLDLWQLGHSHSLWR